MEGLEITLAQESRDASLLSDWIKEEGIERNTPCMTKEEKLSWVEYFFSFADFGAVFLASYNNEPCALASLNLFPYTKLAHQANFHLVVKKEFQRKGIGSALLDYLMWVGKRRFSLEVLSLETIEDSSLVPFIKAKGFSEFCRFEKWYRGPKGFEPKLCFQRVLE